MIKQRISLRNQEDQQEEENFLVQPSYKPDPFRKHIVVEFGLLSLVVGLSYSGYSSIGPQIRQIFQLSTLEDFLFSSAYLIMSVVLALPAGYIVGYCSIRTNILIIALCTLIGSALRCFISYQFAFAVVGQFVFAASYPFLRGMITRISATWFTLEERPMATAVMFSLLVSFEAVSFVLPSWLIDINDIPLGSEQKYRKKIQILHYVQAAVTFIVMLCAYFFFKEKPAHYVTPTASISRQRFSSSLRTLCCHKDYFILCGFAAITNGIVISYKLTMRSAFSKYGITSSSIAIFSIISIPLLITSQALSGYIAGRFKFVKGSMIFLGFLMLLVILFLIVFLQVKSSTVFGIVFVLLQMLATPCSSLSYELGAEITFPVAEGVSASLQNALVLLFSLLLIQFIQPFIYYNVIDIVLIIYFAAQSVAFCLIIIVEQDFKRIETDQQMLDDDRIRNILQKRK